MPALARERPLPGGEVAGPVAYAVDLTRLLRGLVAATAAAFVGAFGIAAFFRLGYPFALHGAEPASLVEVERVLRGEPLYVEPTLHHVPLIYGPIYSYFAAALALLVGDTFASVRLASLMASLAALVIIARLVQRETGNWTAGLVAAGLYAASYPYADTALDLGRVDALFTLCIVSALYAARRPSFEPQRSAWAIAASGGFVALAAFTKLPLGALPIGLAILIYVMYAHRRLVLVYVLALSLPIAVGVLLLWAQNGPWAIWYLWDLPRLHELRIDLTGRFWWTDILPRFIIALLLGPLFVVNKVLHGDRRTLIFYAAATGSLFALSWISRSNIGGAANVLLPAYAMSAVLFGLAFYTASGFLVGGSIPARAFHAYLLVVCLVQFGLVAYNPRMLVPYRSDQWADERLAASLAALPGPIFAPDLEGFTRGSGRGEQVMLGPLDEITGAFGGEGTASGRRVMAELERDLHNRGYSYVVLGEADCCQSASLKGLVLSAGYVDAGPLFPPGDVFFDWKTRRTPELHLFAPPGGS